MDGLGLSPKSAPAPPVDTTRTERKQEVPAKEGTVLTKSKLQPRAHIAEQDISGSSRTDGHTPIASKDQEEPKKSKLARSIKNFLPFKGKKEAPPKEEGTASMTHDLGAHQREAEMRKLYENESRLQEQLKTPPQFSLTKSYQMIANTQGKINDLSRELRDLKANPEASQKEIESLRKDIETLTNVSRSFAGQIADQLATMLETDGDPPNATYEFLKSLDNEAMSTLNEKQKNNAGNAARPIYEQLIGKVKDKHPDKLLALVKLSIQEEAAIHKNNPDAPLFRSETKPHENLFAAFQHAFIGDQVEEAIDRVGHQVISQDSVDLQVNPDRIKGEDQATKLAANQHALRSHFSTAMTAVRQSLTSKEVDPALKNAYAELANEVEKHWPGKGKEVATSMLFLRSINPRLISGRTNPRQINNAVIIGKLFQTAATKSADVDKEAYLAFIKSDIKASYSDVDAIMKHLGVS